MDRDELRDRLLRAAVADPAAVDRVVTAALASGGNVARVFKPAGRDDTEAAESDLGAIRMLARPRVFAALATCLVAVVALGVWWTVLKPAAPADGVYRVEAVQAIVPDGMSAAPSNPTAIPDGVYRTTASLSLAPSRVIRVTSDDGTIWILSTDAHDDWPPPGSRVIVGGGETR